MHLAECDPCPEKDVIRTWLIKAGGVIVAIYTSSWKHDETAWG